jgi:hypothetical protein
MCSFTLLHCSVPRLMGYAHVRTGVRLDNSGCLTFIDAKGKDVLGEGREVAEVVLVSALACTLVTMKLQAYCGWCGCAGCAAQAQFHSLAPARMCWGRT